MTQKPIAFLRPDQRLVELVPWTNDDLDQMAEISDSDRRRAASYWRRYLPKRLRDLLDATVSDGVHVG